MSLPVRCESRGDRNNGSLIALFRNLICGTSAQVLGASCRCKFWRSDLSVARDVQILHFSLKLCTSECPLQVHDTTRAA